MATFYSHQPATFTPPLGPIANLASPQPGSHPNQSHVAPPSLPPHVNPISNPNPNTHSNPHPHPHPSPSPIPISSIPQTSPSPNLNGTAHPALYQHQHQQQQHQHHQHHQQHQHHQHQQQHQHHQQHHQHQHQQHHLHQQQQQQQQQQQHHGHHQAQQYQQQQQQHQQQQQQLQLQQQQHQQHQQQFYPNAYPIIPPTSSSPYSVQPQAIGGQAHLAHPHAQQHVPNLNQDYGKSTGIVGGSGNHGGGPASMPPPSTLPNTAAARRAFLQPHGQRTGDRWPVAGNDEQQRQGREQYIQDQVVPYPVEPQQLMQPPIATAGSTASRHPMQNPLTPPSSTDARRSITPTTTTSAEPTPPPPASSSSASQPSKPMNPSPTPSPLESQRVSALLDLNRLLLQEVIALQTSGKSGTPVQAPSPPQSDAKTDGDAAAAMAPKAPPAGKMSFSKEYIEYMRRLQSNLTYLAGIAERHTKPQNVLPYPSIMECPPGSEPEEGKETLRGMYARLRELWPEYKGK